MRIWMIILVFGLTSCKVYPQDFIGNTRSSNINSDRKAINISGKLLRSKETRIVATVPGDTIYDVMFNTEVYNVSLKLRPIQVIYFYNEQGKIKMMTLVNFIEESEVLLYDVDFYSKKDIILIKYRSSDKEGDYIEQYYIPR